MLACRLCKIPLSAQEGCSHCNPIRRNLVVVGEDEEEAPSLSSVSREAMHAVREQIRYHRDILKTNPGNGKVETKLLAAVNTLSKLAAEVRKNQDDGFKAVEAMSFPERLEMFVGWFADLPPAYRLALTERLTAFEAQIAQPVSESLAPGTGN